MESQNELVVFEENSSLKRRITVQDIIELIGYISGLISILVLFISIFSVMLQNPIYDFRIHTISGLGIIKGKEIFNIGIIITGIFQIFFFNSLRMHFKRFEGFNKNIIFSAFLFGVLFCFAEIGAGIFPASKQFGQEHGKVAFLFFHTSLFYTFLFSTLLIQKPETKQIAYLGFGSFLLIFIFLYFRGPFLEWVMGIGIWSWIGIVSSYMILSKVNKKIRKRVDLTEYRD